jgi:hypothetical protein
MTGNNKPVSSRAVLRATGGAVAASVGAAGSASAHCYSCDEVEGKFCSGECVVTTTTANAYDICPFDAMSLVTYVDPGRTGFVWETCEDGCDQAVKVRFGCEDTWWLYPSDLDEAYDCTC